MTGPKMTLLAELEAVSQRGAKSSGPTSKAATWKRPCREMRICIRDSWMEDSTMEARVINRKLSVSTARSSRVSPLRPFIPCLTKRYKRIPASFFVIQFLAHSVAYGAGCRKI